MALLGAAVAAGIVVAVAPSWLWLLLGVLATVALLLAPPWWYLSGVLVGGVATSLLKVLVPGATGLIGQGRAVVLLAGLVLLQVVLRRIDFRVPRATVIAAGLYAASVLLAALVGLSRGGAGTTLSDVQRELSQTVAPLLIALVALHSPRDRPRAFRAFGIAAVCIAMLGITYWAWHSALLTDLPGGVNTIFENASSVADERRQATDRVGFPFVDTDPNSAAAILTMIAAVGVAPLLATGRWVDRVLGVTLLVAMAAAVLMTQSRMGVVLLLVLCAGYAALTPLSARRRAAVALAAFTAGITMLTIVFTLFPDDRQISTEDENLQSRLGIYERVLADLSASPLFGHGLRYGAQPRYSTLSTHNEYLERLVDGGFVGGFAFLVVLGTFVVIAVSTRTDRPVESAIRTGALTAAAVLMVSMTAVASWTAVPFLQVLSWLSFGAISATYASRQGPSIALQPTPPLPPR